MQFRLRTLLIVLAVLPPLLWVGWTKYEAWRKAERDRLAMEAINRWFISAVQEEGFWRTDYGPESNDQKASPLP